LQRPDSVRVWCLPNEGFCGCPGQVGKKKTQDVQFYTEVMESVQTIDAGRRSMYDPDELEEEQREREIRARVSHCPALTAEVLDACCGRASSGSV
jgi:nucleosome binding factor SPN SPT16 subunit